MVGDNGGGSDAERGARVHSLGVVGQFRQLIRTGGVVRNPLSLSPCCLPHLLRQWFLHECMNGRG